jgi:hypothetical protein
MSIGAGIALFVIGAILTFALNFDTGWINLDLVGWIMMVAGVITVIVGIALLMRRRSAVSTTVSSDGGIAQRTTDMDASL